MPRRDHPPAIDAHGPNEPCVNDEHVRRVPPDATGTETVVVGVVHDHPASVRRVKALAMATDPDVLALELPPLAIPLLRRRVRRDDGPIPAVRGRGHGEPASDRDEMAAAVAAAPDARTVGVDGIDGQFLAALARTLRAEGADPGAVRRVAGRTARIALRTGACWLRGATGIGSDDPVPGATYDCPDGDPLGQADHEREHVRQCAALLGAVERPVAARAIDEARESCLARRIAALDDGARVLAVVGWAHLDAVADRL